MEQMQKPLKPYNVIDYLHGKVADYTVSENAIEAVCCDRGVNPSTPVSDVDTVVLHLCYGDLLKYVYLQPGLTKSYSQTNGTWSHKEGATQLSDNDKKKILAEMNRQYAMGGEPESMMAQSMTSGIRMESHGIRPYHTRGRR